MRIILAAAFAAILLPTMASAAGFTGIMDGTNPSYTLTVNPDGSINTKCTSGCAAGGGGSGGTGTSSTVQQKQGATSTLTSISVPATTSTTLLASSTTELFAGFTNTGTGSCQVCEGSTCSATTGYTLAAGQNMSENQYIGAYSGYCPAASSISVTQVTPP